MRVASLVPAAALLLAACQTIDDSDWRGGESTSFNQAERTCKTQTKYIAEEARRGEFFVGCMAALGWTPRPGTAFASLATAPDPT